MRKGVKTLVLGVLLFLAGGFVVPAIVILPMIFADPEHGQFLVPGEHEVMAEEPGRYYLWNHFRTIFDGETYNRPKYLPDGMEISVETAAGEELDFVGSTSISVTIGSSARQSIGYVEIREPGVVRISVSGAVQEHLFSFSKSKFKAFLGLLLGGFGFSMIVALAGVGIAIWGIVKLATGNGRKDQNV